MEYGAPRNPGGGVAWPVQRDSARGAPGALPRRARCGSSGAPGGQFRPHCRWPTCGRTASPGAPAPGGRDGEHPRPGSSADGRPPGNRRGCSYEPGPAMFSTQCMRHFSTVKRLAPASVRLQGRSAESRLYARAGARYGLTWAHTGRQIGKRVGYTLTSSNLVSPLTEQHATQAPTGTGPSSSQCRTRPRLPGP